jgi:hypothetical protein
MELAMPTEWSAFWQRAANLRWGAMDQEILEEVANLLGWGPNRTLLEIGAGRGLHSKFLYEYMRCDRPELYDPCPEAHQYITRAGLKAIAREDEITRTYDIVWSSGLVEHFFEDARQEIIDKHFRLSHDWVVLVVPRANWQRRIFRPRQEVPDAILYREGELMERMEAAALKCWGGAPAGVGHRCFAPLFGVRHIPDGIYSVADRIASPFLPAGLILGWARRQRDPRDAPGLS